MQKLAVLLLFLLCSCLSNALEKASVTPVSTLSYSDLQWVEAIIKQYPEVGWLADSIEAKESHGESYSERLFGKKFDDFDETIAALYCFKMILNGGITSYEQFVGDKEPSLSKENFHELHYQTLRLLQSKYEGFSDLQLMQVIETAIVLKQLGKSEKAREQLAKFSSTEDPEDFYEELLSNQPDVLSSFERLSPNAKKLLTNSSHLSHLNELVLLEAGIELFTKFQNCQCIDRTILHVASLIHICEEAARGHYDENYHNAVQELTSSIDLLLAPAKSPKEAYHFYLEKRASWLGLNLEDESNRILARVGAMLNLFTKQEGGVLRSAIVQMDKEDQIFLISQLDAETIEESLSTPLCLAAVLQNFSQNSAVATTKDKRLTQTVLIALPLVAKAIKMYREMIRTGELDRSVQLSFKQMAHLALFSAERFIVATDLEIDKAGYVNLK